MDRLHVMVIMINYNLDTCKMMKSDDLTIASFHFTVKTKDIPPFWCAICNTYKVNGKKAVYGRYI